MKKLIVTAIGVGVLGLGLNPAHAGDREWATVGKVLTGVTAGLVLAKAFEAPPAYASVSYGYAAPGYTVSYSVSNVRPCPPPVMVAPPPVFVAPPPIVCAPAPVVYAPARVVVAPPPVYHVTYVHPGRGHGPRHCR